MFSGEAENNNFIVFYLIQTGIEVRIYPNWNRSQDIPKLE
jgi:hypothetical protein